MINKKILIIAKMFLTLLSKKLFQCNKNTKMCNQKKIDYKKSLFSQANYFVAFSCIIASGHFE